MRPIVSGLLGASVLFDRQPLLFCRVQGSAEQMVILRPEVAALPDKGQEQVEGVDLAEEGGISGGGHGVRGMRGTTLVAL